MLQRRRGNTLERWEIALVKALLARGGYNDQDILAFFTRPTRSINHRAIGEIRTETKHRAIRPASFPELDEFLATWPDVDPDTGLSIRGDELLIKAREAMIAAVSTFNGAGLHFRTEIFIVTSIIAWTYLLHAFYRREGIDYRYWKSSTSGREVAKTQHGAEKFWELGKCLRCDRCPLNIAERANLEFLLELRHEIEHRSTKRIDDAVSAKLQACALNFNSTVKELFGPQFSLERRLPIALQFVTFSLDQRALLKKSGGLPPHVTIMMDAFHKRLSDEEAADPRFAFRVAFVPRAANRANQADVAYEIVHPNSEEAAEIEKILLKEVDRRKYLPNQIVRLMRQEGFRYFKTADHTRLWQGLDAKRPGKGYGTTIFGSDWGWYEKWVDRVREHCIENADQYGKQQKADHA